MLLRKEGGGGWDIKGGGWRVEAGDERGRGGGLERESVCLES